MAATAAVPRARQSFETEEDSAAEDRLRAKSVSRVIPSGPVGWLNIKDVIWRVETLPLLSRHGNAARNLTRSLEDGVSSGFPPPTLASSMGMRAIRQSVFGALLRALQSYTDADLRTFTIVNANWDYSPEELDKVSAAQIKNQLRTHLNRLGITKMPGPFLAFLHGEYEPRSGRFQLHYHGVTTAKKAAALHDLKDISGYERTPTGAAPIRCVSVNDRVHQFTYLLKSYWPSKAVREVRPGEFRRDRKGQRIPEPFHA